MHCSKPYIYIDILKFSLLYIVSISAFPGLTSWMCIPFPGVITWRRTPRSRTTCEKGTPIPGLVPFFLHDQPVKGKTKMSLSYHNLKSSFCNRFMKETLIVIQLNHIRAIPFKNTPGGAWEFFEKRN